MTHSMPELIHWDDVRARRVDFGHIGGLWADLGNAAGSLNVGVRRIQVDPGKWSTPAHVHGIEEEIFYVLAGSGLSWQDGRVHEVEAGDCLVHLADGEAHTVRAGADGLDVLAFGHRTRATATRLPRSGIAWLGRTWTEVGRGGHPFAQEAEVGEPEVGEPSPRPASIVATVDVEPVEWSNGGDVSSLRRNLGRAAGSVRTGMQHFRISPGKLGTLPHCHAAEEELFVVLEGTGLLLLGDEEHPVRPGSVVSRQPATRVPHAFRAGEGELVLLAYGTREPNDIVYYPRSGKIFFRGVGVLTRLDTLDYWDGEP